MKIGWSIIFVAVACLASPAWGMLSFLEENEYHCRGCHLPAGEMTTANRHHKTRTAMQGNCLVCHPRDSEGKLKPTERNCKACHVNSGQIDPFTGVLITKSPHHRSSINSECVFCHDASKIPDPPPDQYAGLGDPSPQPLVAEPAGEQVALPVFLPGVQQTVGVRDAAYSAFNQTDCRACHTPPDQTTTGTTHHTSYRAEISGCVYCHVSSGLSGISLERDCLRCHVAPGSTDPFTGSAVTITPHHDSPRARGGVCDFCHGSDIVRTQGTGLTEPDAPQYPATLITPTPRDCLNCHNLGSLPPASDQSANPVLTLHHAASTECGFCHSEAPIPPIRQCESCHTIATLHGIAGHTADASRCVGCHGAYLTDTPPLLDVSTLESGATTGDPLLNITGKATSGSGSPSITINDVPAPTAADGSFSYALLLVPGPNTVTITATAPNGLATEDVREVTYVEAAAPPLSITAPADGTTTTSAEIEVEGTAEGANAVAITHNGRKQKGNVKLNGGKFSRKLILAPGMNTIEVSLVGGNRRIAQKRTVYFAPETPALTITSPATDTVVTSSGVDIRGNVAEGGTVTIVVDGKEAASFSAAGDFSFPIHVKSGKTVVRVQAIDSAGKKSEVMRTIVHRRPGLPRGWLRSPGRLRR